MPERILITAEAAGGAWQYGIDLARGLSRLGVETVVALTGPSPSDAQRAAAASVPGLTVIDTGLVVDLLTEDRAALKNVAEGIAGLARASGAEIVQLHTAALAAEGEFEMPVVVAHQSCAATWWQAVNGTPLPDDFAWRARLDARGLDRRPEACKKVCKKRLETCSRPR